MPIPHPLPDDLAELVAQRFRLIGEPMRIKLLDQLREGERASATSWRFSVRRSRTSPSTSVCSTRPASSVGARTATASSTQSPTTACSRCARRSAGAWRDRWPRLPSYSRSGPGAERTAMMQLFQTEWCPSSRRVRQRLTELGVDHVVRQVPVVRSSRHALVDATGSNSIPALVLDEGTAITGEIAIRAYLDDHFAEPSGADEQRDQSRVHRPSRMPRGALRSSLHPLSLFRRYSDEHPCPASRRRCVLAALGRLAARARALRDGRHGHARLRRPRCRDQPVVAPTRRLRGHQSACFRGRRRLCRLPRPASRSSVSRKAARDDRRSTSARPNRPPRPLRRDTRAPSPSPGSSSRSGSDSSLRASRPRSPAPAGRRPARNPSPPAP